MIAQVLSQKTGATNPQVFIPPPVTIRGMIQLLVFGGMGVDEVPTHISEGWHGR